MDHVAFTLGRENHLGLDIREYNACDGSGRRKKEEYDDRPCIIDGKSFVTKKK